MMHGASETPGWEPVHQIIVTYTNGDDGIWLNCDGCGWTKNLGFFPTIEEVNLGVADHQPPVIE